jgi:hypothetical protein
MTKPIGYYCNYVPGGSGLIPEMEEAWGSYFQSLNNSERLWLLSCLTGTMTADVTDNYDPHQVGESVTDATERFHELSYSDQLGLATAILDQLKATWGTR